MIESKRYKKNNIHIPPLEKRILPGDNFYLHVNSYWIKKTHIPESSVSYSVNEEIQDQIDEKLFEILRECEIFASKGINAKGSKIRDIIGRLILSSMRFKVQKNSKFLLKEKIQNLHCIRSLDDIGEVLGYLCKHNVSTILGTYLQLERTEEDTSIYNLVITDGSLGLPDDTYYRATAPGKLRTLYSYIQLVKKLCNILEIEDLSTVIPIEAFFSAHIEKNGSAKDNNNNLFKGVDLVKRFPKFPWKTFFQSYGIENFLENTFRIHSTKYIEVIEKSFSSIVFEQWKQLFILHTILHALPLLPPPFDDIHFDFFEKRLRGQKKKLSQNYLTLNLVRDYLSVPLSILYKEKYLEDSLKKDATKFIKTIQDSAVKQIDSNSWLEPNTKKRATKKVKDMVLCIGWPEKYPILYIPPLHTDNLLYNIYALAASKTFQEVQLLNKKTTPGVTWNEPNYLVNAFYYNEINQFVIPAGILMYPFFNKNKKALGWNYGGLGAVIGHEMIHAFDVDGKNYDENGVFKHWWSNKDLKKFHSFSKKLIEQYSLSKVFNVSVDGKKTLSENLADLGGLSIALEALKKEISSLNDSEKKEELKQFFISYAVSWRTKEEKQKVLQSLFMDVHAPAEFRVNNIVIHFDEWYSAFDIEVSNNLYVPPEERIRVF
jgi:putative endopeptidase